MVEADQAARAADQAGQRLLRLLDHARLSRDVQRTACVDAKLTQANSFGRMIHDRRERLRAAAARDDRAAVAYERSVIRTLEAQLRRVERQGQECVYPELGVANGRTVVIVEVGPEVPEEDPSVLTDEERRRRH